MGLHGLMKNKTKKLLIFGASVAGIKILKFVQNKLFDEIDVIGFLDNDSKKQSQKIEGIEICPPKQLSLMSYDFIYCALDDFSSVQKQLMSLGCPQEKIVSISSLNFELINEPQSYVSNKYMQAKATVATITQNFGETFADKKILEIGPGYDFFTALYLVSKGASVTVVDKYLSNWNLINHLPVFKEACEVIQDNAQFTSILEDVLNDNSSGTDRFSPLNMVGCGLEDFEDDLKYDLIYSCAVFEHLSDHRKAIERMFQVQDKGGISVHWVDFRFHSEGFLVPLDHLLQSPEEFKQDFEKYNGTIGCQMRPKEMENIFKDIGYKILLKDVLDTVNEVYFEGFIKKLRACRESAYMDFPEDELHALSVLYVLKK